MVAHKQVVGRSRRFLTTASKNKILCNCLNRNFDLALKEIRAVPTTEMDHHLIQTCLIRSCYWGHIASVDYIWYKYVMQLHSLVIRPELLCDIGNLAIQEEKYFLPEHIYMYYKTVYGNNAQGLRWEDEYKLLKNKMEGFAKGTMEKTTFKEKWKVFLEDLDNYLPKDTVFRVRDFPYLTKSVVGAADSDLLYSILFNENKLTIANPSTLTLLLNMILLQSEWAIEFRISTFKKFLSVYKSLNADYRDSLLILFHECQGNAYRLSEVTKYVEDTLKGYDLVSLQARFG